MEDLVHYNIIKYLKNLKNDAALQTGVQYISTALNLFENEENDKKYGIQGDIYPLLEKAFSGQQKPTTNESSVSSDVDKKFEEYKKILQSKNYFSGTTEGTPEYEERVNKAKEKFYEKYKTQETVTNESPDELKAKAEGLKNQGNDKFRNKDYLGAIQSYSEAIKTFNNAIYYCNRGIAYSKIDKHNEAIEDYNKCIELDPKYIKAYDRLGCTYLHLNRAHEAIDTFNKGLVIDSTNAELQQHLNQAQQQAEDEMGGVGGGQAQNPGLGGGLPNLGNLGGMNMGNIQDVLQNPNFMENLGPLLQNPAVMNMTMQLMQDPNFQNMMGNMMQNPNLANLFGGMGGAGGGQNQ
jgi:tetratricopeptide (TPR) repeat protein